MIQFLFLDSRLHGNDTYWWGGIEHPQTKFAGATHHGWFEDGLIVYMQSGGRITIRPYLEGLWFGGYEKDCLQNRGEEAIYV